MEKDPVSFIILHYQDYETTVKCIQYIQKNIRYENYYIIIVDNGSPNKSGALLKKKYIDSNIIHVVISDVNLGFAKGNNLGFQYAKNKLQSRFIVVINNDIFIEQENFIDVLIEKYYYTKAYVIGPDILTPSKMHQNPLRDVVCSEREVKKKIIIKSIFLYYFYLKKLLHLEDKVNILENWFEKIDKKNHDQNQWENDKINVVLQGACIVFTPTYIINENNAFSPETFMYGEEDLLAYKCQKKGYKTLYTPAIRVLHLNGETTSKTYTNSLEKKIFSYKYIIVGWKILLKNMRDKRYDI